MFGGNNHIKFIIILLQMFLLASCRISSNDKLVEYFTKEVNEFEIEYQSVIIAIDTIDTKNIRYCIHRFPNDKKHLQVMEYFPQDSTFYNDFIFPEQLHSFLLRRKITNLFVKVNRDVCFTFLHKSNYDFRDVSLIYFFNGFDKGKVEYEKLGFEVFQNAEIPINYGNWLYAINDNWGILSPKKQDNE